MFRKFLIALRPGPFRSSIERVIPDAWREEFAPGASLEDAMILDDGHRELGLSSALGDQRISLSGTEGEVRLIRELVDKLEWQISTEDGLNGMEQQLTELSARLEYEYLRGRYIYDQLVPKRAKTFANIEVTSKFRTSRKGLIEFVDFVEHGKGFILVLVSFRSYLLSSSFLQVYSKQKALIARNGLSQASRVVTELARSLENMSDSEENSFLMCYCNGQGLGISGIHFGRTLIFTGDKKMLVAPNRYPIDPSFIDTASFSYQGHRGERLVVCSPGLEQCFLSQELLVAPTIARLMSGDKEHFLEETLMQAQKEDEQYSSDCCVVSVQISHKAITST